ncbi:MAG: phosphate-starvation-inducible PsiE family protein [Clostridiales bacterium]|uniref:phosphate-starvation-inducible PsiE family protein n=1 Tax=Peptostreptococcaceae TaxID=186804 RepID=UPI002A39F155|nr:MULTISPECIES: phosphate-starvation-inducible PsiE family protein [Peptostreptococcaceae]MCI5630308.1 phosphate-starvation-inducible PsiE family protein [Clostridium sp.]MDD5879038.1 phosphate-starvation-inducible PsiE family protein [Clostridiales bacterium]MCI6458724.1 phosphate-starvation-inducible PsiE family protein [Clostridium sp.]MCI7204471.1 phosphate-starvation-inducible PsiE family protein [Clostridium sp.]MDD7754442.1 phosphate-starvation-inducible PsiE family protein [Clostridia
MIKKNDKRLLKISKRFETALSIILLILVLLGMMDLIRSVYQAYIVDFANPVEYTQLNGFLAEALLLVIGVELVVMLSLHIPGVLLEVLLYAIARKLILLPKSSGMGDLLLGILAIGVIFTIRKYLMSPQEREISLSRIYNLKSSKIEEDKDEII